MRIDFHSSPSPTVGVEWELALVDRTTRDLVNAADDLFASATPQMASPERLHKELLRNTVEVVTGICHTVGQAREQLRDVLDVVVPAADQLGVDLFGAGSHPFAKWSEAQVTPGARYEELIDRTQWWGRQMMIWGVHVHVGLPERDRVLPVIGGLLNHYPHLLALSASSPMWDGMDTGYASNRAQMFQQLPTAGLPFQFEKWEEFERFSGDQITTGVIEELNEIRWDIRPVPRLGTVETRVCDGVSTLDEISALAAFVQCLVVDLDTRIASGEKIPTLPPWHVQENKWRAARYGLDAIVILDADNREQLVTEHLAEELQRLEPIAAQLGCEEELDGVWRMAEHGASYQRQRRVAEENDGSLVAVVDSVVRELRESLG
ncbi:glutamate--cysteine ligase [Nocardioides yefusunii]|uniref:Putative glutamate--cysteine ligase 2 n=1 Tax=Nocardioides yefusunii TaxID=2500546 RepID=A0ABW1QWC2_9ACTN|nr:glutamate--cysteine ligase [Nocardioides yefusunii]